jgi:NitT/TauT family transport system substrate-binding protein
MRRTARWAARLTVTFLILGLLAALGCATGPSGEPDGSGTPIDVTPAAIKIGTLATQDALPLWVAEAAGYFEEQGIPSVEIITFQSATECQTAFTSGAVDALMTDIIVAANLQASGTPVQLATVMLGSEAAEGRFAVVAAPGSSVASMGDLRGVAVGTASATITEYILDKLMEEAGYSAADVKREEVGKMPVRFQLLMEGQLKAAVLPEPFVTLAEQGGAAIVAGGDDTKAKQNVSQSVLCISAEYAETREGAAAVKAVLAAWDLAVADINAAPDDFRQVLVDKARLPEPLAGTYKVSTYPMAAPPTSDEIQTVLDWMTAKGYLKAEPKPAEMLGAN